MGNSMSEEKMLDRVRKLLERANHPNTNKHERDACIKKADALMLQHSISEAMLDLTKDKNSRRKPEVRVWQAWEGYVWRAKFQTLISEIARGHNVKMTISFAGEVTVVGMSDDLNYVEMLWTQTYYAFLTKLEPRWESNRSFDGNVYALKVAGRSWPQICFTANEHDVEVPWPDGGRLIRAYKRECKRLGETPTNHTQRHGAYRESFAETFVTAICYRLEEMRNARREATEEAGAGLVLADVRSVVEDKYYEMFPQFHPDVRSKEVELRRQAQRERLEAERIAREEMLARMTDKQRQDFFDKEERQRRRDIAANERYWESLGRAHDSSGSKAGRAAADSVDLGRNQRVDSERRGELG